MQNLGIYNLGWGWRECWDISLGPYISNLIMKARLSVFFVNGDSWVQISAEGNQSSVRRWGQPLRAQLLLLYMMEVTRSGPIGRSCSTAQGSNFNLTTGGRHGTLNGALNPNPGPAPDCFRHIVVRWNVNKNPERCTWPLPWARTRSLPVYKGCPRKKTIGGGEGKNSGRGSVENYFFEGVVQVY